MPVVVWSPHTNIFTVKDENSEDQDRSGGINLDILIHSEDAFPRTMLVLPFTDMISEGFPVPPHDFSQCTGILYR